MAYMDPKSLSFYLFLLVVKSLGETCPQKCTCAPKKFKLKVNCRGKGLTEVFSHDKFPGQMKILDLSRNNISVIKRGFLDRHPQLERLYLHNNSIKVLEERAFIGLGLLNRLVLKHNKIKELKAKSFIGLPNLDLLDLSSNEIKSIDKLAFYGFQRLTKLILNNNSFKKIENGTFDSLKSLKKLGMKNVPLSCDCSLNPFIRYLTETASLKKIIGTCFGKPSTAITALKGRNLCERLPDLSIIPKNDQVVAVGDSFNLACNTTNKRRMVLVWTKDNKRIVKGKNIKLSTPPSKDQLRMIVYVKSVTESDAGEYSCMVDGERIKPKKINIRVVSSTAKMCERESVESDLGHLLWPVTFAETTATIKCPSLGNDDKHDTIIRRNCTPNGVWGDVNFGNCKWIPLSQKLNNLLMLLKQENFEDVAGIASKLRQLTHSSDFQSHSDVSLTLNVVNGVIRKQGDDPFSDKVLDDILASFSNVMDVDSGLLYEAQRRDQSPSRLAARLELISRKIVNKNLHRVFPNIVLGSAHLQKDKFHGETCNVFFSSKNPSLPDGIHCKPQKRKDFVVSIHIPKTIFENLNATGNTRETLEVQFLVYRNERLFPNVISNTTQEFMKGRNVSSSVLAIQMASIKELNLTEPLVITFATEAGRSPLISHVDFAEKVVGNPWSPNIDCHVNRSTYNTTTVDCGRLVNKNLAIISYLSDNIIVDYPMEMVVYLGAIIASLFLLATLLTFAVIRKLRYDHDDAAMLMNACLSMVVVIITFVFGIYRTNNELVCLVVGFFLHYFFLASLFWLASSVLCVSRRMKAPKDSEENFNPVLQYYMVGWGVPAIICGITLSINLDNYKTSQYCWMTESAGLGAFVGPACVLFIVNCVLIVRLQLLLTSSNGTLRYNKGNSEEERLQADEPGVLEQTPDLDGQTGAEKSGVKLFLLATCVIMMLIYVNFILAYFLIKSRGDKLLWTVLSYVYALANIALGACVFLFHCASRRDVREGWRKSWKNMSLLRINFGRWRTLWITPKRTRKNDQAQPIPQTLLNDENINSATVRDEVDQQSNITLPSSAALTNDVFVNGRPLSTARVSLLDEADIPPEEDDRGSEQVNEGDILDADHNDGEHWRSQNSVQSSRRLAGCGDGQVVPAIPREYMSDFENRSVVGDTSLTEMLEENTSDITDGVTSKPESLTPTAVEVSLPTSSTPLDSSTREFPRLFPKLLPRTDTIASPSSSSLSETPARPLPNFKRKRSSESLNSRSGAGSIGPRAQKFSHLQSAYPKSSSSTLSEIPLKVPDQKGKRLGESLNSHKAAHPERPNGVTQRPRSRYKDGREKPEPKQWTGNLGPKIAYVPVPHVSKIHRETCRNETSV